MADIDAITKAFGTALATVGLRVFSEIPNKIDPPVALIGLGKGDNDTLDNALIIEFGVLVLVSATNTRGAQEAIRAYTSSTDSHCIQVAVQADNTLSGTVDSVDFTGWDPPAVYPVGDISYLGIEFNFQVLAL
jgi:hypothetical protein